MERPALGLRPPPRPTTLPRTVSKPSKTVSTPEVSPEPTSKPGPTPPPGSDSKPTPLPKPASETDVKPDLKPTSVKKPEPEHKARSDEKPDPPKEPESEPKPCSQSELQAKAELRLPEFPGIESQELVNHFQLFLQKLDPKMATCYEKYEEFTLWENLGLTLKRDHESISPSETAVKPITLLQPDHKPNAESQSETKPVKAPESVSKPVVSKLMLEMKPEAEPSVVPVSKPPTILEPKPALKPEDKPTMVTETMSKPTPELKCETKAAIVPEWVSKPSVSKMTPKPKSTTFPGAVSKPVSLPKSVEEPKPRASSVAKPSLTPGSVFRTATKPMPKPKPALMPKSEAMPEFKPVPIPESTTKPLLSIKLEAPVVEPESAIPPNSTIKTNSNLKRVASPSPISKPKPKLNLQPGPGTQSEVEFPLVSSTQDLLKYFQLFLKSIDPEKPQRFLKCDGAASGQTPKQIHLSISEPKPQAEVKPNPKASPQSKPEIKPSALPDLHNWGILEHFQLFLQKLDPGMVKSFEVCEENTTDKGAQLILKSESKPKAETDPKTPSVAESKPNSEPALKTISKSKPPSNAKPSPKPVSRLQDETKHKPMHSPTPQSAMTPASQLESQAKFETGSPLLSTSNRKELLKTFPVLLQKLGSEMGKHFEKCEVSAPKEGAKTALKSEPNPTSFPKAEAKPKSQSELKTEQEEKPTVVPYPKNQELLKYFQMFLQKIDSKSTQCMEKCVETLPSENAEPAPASDPKAEPSPQFASSPTSPSAIKTTPILPPKPQLESKPKAKSEINPPLISDPNNQNLIKSFQRLLHKFNPEIAKYFEKCDEIILSDYQKSLPKVPSKPTRAVLPKSLSQSKQEERPQPGPGLIPKSLRKPKPHSRQEAMLETKPAITLGSNQQDLLNYFQQFLQRFDPETSQYLEKCHERVEPSQKPGSRPELEAKSEAKPSVDSSVNNPNSMKMLQRMPWELDSKMTECTEKCEEPELEDTINPETRPIPIPIPEPEPKPEIQPNSESDHQNMMKYFLLFLQRFDPEMARRFEKPPSIAQTKPEPEDQTELKAKEPFLDHNSSHKEMMKYFHLFLQKFDPEMAECFDKCADTLPSEDSKAETKPTRIPDTVEEPVIVSKPLPDEKPISKHTPVSDLKSLEDQGTTNENLVKYFQLFLQMLDSEMAKCINECDDATSKPILNSNSKSAQSNETLLPDLVSNDKEPTLSVAPGYNNQEVLKCFPIFLQKLVPEMSQCLETSEMLITAVENFSLSSSSELNSGQVTKPVDAVNILRLFLQLWEPELVKCMDEDEGAN